ncbi:MAG TPA: hypothetical protein VLJ10_03785 [Candidatus Bathyarchaeia archaeon]|nr:hypothetical protein [Candidatus Bathyarchaeia archaeon]
MLELQHRRLPFAVRFISTLIIFTFLTTTILPPGYAQTIGLTLPLPGSMVGPSAEFVPVLLKGMTVHPENPLQFEFIIDSGHEKLKEPALKKESERLVKYFLASMTVPQNDLWVNLSPYEKDRIIPDELGKTELGRDLLSQDYILKQLTATLMYPEEELGKKFWDRMRTLAKKEYGVDEIPTDVFNKVWILPETATVYEYENTVYIVESKLKVMLADDYEQQLRVTSNKLQEEPSSLVTRHSSLYKEVVSEIILPEIEKEVNKGKNFAPLRQIYHSLILAKWYKQTVKNSLMSQVYIDKNKTAGIALNDRQMKERIYDQYMQAYKKGVFNYIKEDYDALSQTVIPKQYFSGGFKDSAMLVGKTQSAAKVSRARTGQEFRSRVNFEPQTDAAMLGGPYTLTGARKVLDYIGGHNLTAVLKAAKIIGSSDDKNETDIKRLKKALSEYYDIRIEKYLSPEQRFEVYIDLLKKGEDKTVVLKLGELGDSRAIKPLMKELAFGGNGYSEYVLVVEASLKKLGATNEQLINWYIAVLSSDKSNYFSQNFALERISELGVSKERWVDVYIAALSMFQSLDVEKAVANLKKLINSDQDIEKLIDWLEENESDKNVLSIGSILESKSSSNEKIDKKRSAIVQRKHAIALRLSEQSLNKLMKDAKDEAWPSGRKNAINELKTFEDPRVLPFLLSLPFPNHSEEGEEIYKAIKQALQNLGATKEQMIEWYLSHLDRGFAIYAGERIQGDVIRSLGELHTPKAIGPLVSMLAHRQSFVRHYPSNKEKHEYTMKLIGDILGEFDLEILSKEMNSAKTSEDYQAFYALSNLLYSLGDPRGREYTDDQIEKEKEIRTAQERAKKRSATLEAFKRASPEEQRRMVIEQFPSNTSKHMLEELFSEASRLFADGVLNKIIYQPHVRYDPGSPGTAGVADANSDGSWFELPEPPTPETPEQKEMITFEIERIPGEMKWREWIYDDGLVKPLNVDQAMVTQSLDTSSHLPNAGELENGGIDMNEIAVDRANEEGAKTIRFEMEGMEPLLNMDIQGFSPIIIDMVPINSVLPLLGLAPTEKGIKYGKEEADHEMQVSLVSD